MKNIHLIPTDKPSFGKYLVINKEGKLCIWNTDTMGSQISLNPQNIYITSDEKIKKGEWNFNPKTNKISKVGHHGHHGYSSRKIILTTDQDLIKDGVQAINDEFLEWFVKNTSCEEVNTIIEYKDGYSNWFKYDKEFWDKMGNKPKFGTRYKIIIPKEEI